MEIPLDYNQVPVIAYVRFLREYDAPSIRLGTIREFLMVFLLTIKAFQTVPEEIHQDRELVFLKGPAEVVRRLGRVRVRCQGRMRPLV